MFKVRRPLSADSALLAARPKQKNVARALGSYKDPLLMITMIR